MTTEEITKNDDQGMVLYCDAGVRPNPGYGGIGIHGYLYKKEKSKKGSGNPDHILTNNGYITKKDFIAGDNVCEITPIHYVDGFGSFGYEISNNVGEISAAIAALNHASKFVITELLVITDSEYVQKGITQWLNTWKQNNWVKQDLSEVANRRQWEELDKAYQSLVSHGVNVRVEWIKGHADFLGNELADRLATVGVMASKQKDIRTEINIQVPEGYWKYSPDKHPFLNNRRMYFNTINTYIRPGEYYLGDHGKDDDLLGKRVSDGAYAVTILDEPDNVLETVRNYQIELAGNSDTIMMVRLDHLFRPETHQQIDTYGRYAMEQASTHRLDLRCLDGEPLTRELRPPKLAMWAVDSINDLATRLQEYLNKDTKLTCTDITPLLYDITNRTSKSGETKNLCKFKSEYNVGHAALDVIANYAADEYIKQCPVRLTLGIDLLERNALKRLENFDPTITVITWLDAPDVVRYATVIEASNGRGIWSGTYSNTVYLKK